MENTTIDIIEPMQAMSTQQQDSSLFDVSLDNILYLAEKADKMIDAMNKIMVAAIKITSEHDWVLISGKPYLQESGATKVARLFGISWKIDYPRVECDKLGYKTFTYKGEFTMNGQSIESEGSRSMKDDFFAKKGNVKKSIDEISERNVRQSAYTNCINNGIKRIIPNLRNIDIHVLKDAGLDANKISGYAFKTDSENENSTFAEFKCEKCGTSISSRVVSYSQKNYEGHAYCMNCQQLVGKEDSGYDGSRNQPTA